VGYQLQTNMKWTLAFFPDTAGSTSELYRVTGQAVNDFKWQINYVRAIKYLLSCYQRLGKFNAIMCCAKYHNRPLLT